MDKAAVTAFYEMIWLSLAAEGSKSPHLEFHEILTDGDLYACRFTMSGTHRGPFLGVSATNRTYVLPGITILRFGNDRRHVVERFSSADMLGLLVQFGALSPPA
jgi:predicted ester cyclase